jgi:flagellar biogenesis protein FliO
MKQQKILKVNVTPKYMKKLMRVFTVGNVLIASRRKIMTISVEGEVLVVETVSDLLELLSRQGVWVRVKEDTSLCEFLKTDEAEIEAFNLKYSSDIYAKEKE